MGVFSCQRTAYARLLGAGGKRLAFPPIVYILYIQVVMSFARLYWQCFQMVRPFETRLAGLVAFHALAFHNFRGTEGNRLIHGAPGQVG
jgi:hypothetical protein